MKVGDLFESLDRDTVIAELERQRPPYVKHRSGHIEAWNEIVTLKPIPTECVCHVGTRPAMGGKVIYLDVYGLTEGCDDHFSITFVDWREWMSMEIVIDDDAAGATPEAVLAAIIDEMTFHGCSNNEVSGN